MPDLKRLTAYLLFDRDRILGTRKSRPQLRPGEYAVRVVLEVPVSVFAVDVATATVLVPERAVAAAEVTIEEPGEASDA